MKKDLKEPSTHKQASLSNAKLSKIERSFQIEFSKATDDYLSTELEKYRKLTIIIEQKQSDDAKTGK